MTFFSRSAQFVYIFVILFIKINRFMDLNLLYLHVVNNRFIFTSGVTLVSFCCFTVTSHLSQLFVFSLWPLFVSVCPVMDGTCPVSTVSLVLQGPVKTATTENVFWLCLFKHRVSPPAAEHNSNVYVANLQKLKRDQFWSSWIISHLNIWE